jgi:hypothetical protein
MSLVSYLVSGLVQGVSQQPDAQRDPAQAEEQINGMSSMAEGLRKRDPSHVIARVSETGFGNVFFHQIERDSAEKYLVAIGPAGIKVFDLAGGEKTVAAPGGYGYLATATNATADIRAATIADVTFISNTKTVPAMDAATAPAVPRTFPHECLVWVRAANYGQTYNVNLNGTLATVQTPVAPVVVTGSTTTENRISSESIATFLAGALASVPGVFVFRVGSVIHFVSNSPITVAATDARSNADITAITSKVQAFTQLPTIAPEGYQVEVTGDPGNQFDNYYVRFQPRPAMTVFPGMGSFGEGAWEETVAPGAQYRINPVTMPHVLVRLPSGTFYFGPANGSVQGGVVIPKWGERTAGDLNSAPTPSFIGFPIQDVFVYKNRLGMLADENVILSRARDFFEFFPETVTSVLDSDPIDLSASSPRVAVLRYAVPYQDELIVFSDQTQFRFGSPDSLLSPSTAQITVLTQYELDPNVRPIAVAGTIIFCQPSGQWSRFREFSVQGAGTALVANAEEITGQVGSYIPSGLTKLSANDTGSMWFAISAREGYRDRIYVFKFYDRGNERVQASWSFWQFNGADQVLQILCVQETLYALVRYASEVWLEKMPVTDRMSELAGNPAPFLLDRQVTTSAAAPAGVRVSNGVWDPLTLTTRWTLPYTIRARTQVWSGHEAGQNGGVLLGEASSGNTIVGRGDWRNRNVYIGETYDFVYRFTRFKFYKETAAGRSAVNAMRTQIRHAKLRYSETGFFQAWVMAERRPKAVYTFDGTTLAVRKSFIGTEPQQVDPDPGRYGDGVFTIPIQSQGEKCVVEIHNDTPLPCKLTSCEWVGMMSGRARLL